MSATLLGAFVPQDSPASALTDQVPHLSITLDQAAVQSGDHQQINVQIAEVAERRIPLILVVTYPSGEIVRSLHYVERGVGSIAWEIPADAGAGEAAFRLIADGCACGEHNTIPLQNPVDGTVEGTFVVSALP
jgi:hypothetical protein